MLIAHVNYERVGIVCLTVTEKQKQIPCPCVFILLKDKNELLKRINTNGQRFTGNSLQRTKRVCRRFNGRDKNKRIAWHSIV